MRPARLEKEKHYVTSKAGKEKRYATNKPGKGKILLLTRLEKKKCC